MYSISSAVEKKISVYELVLHIVVADVLLKSKIYCLILNQN